MSELADAAEHRDILHRENLVLNSELTEIRNKLSRLEEGKRAVQKSSDSANSMKLSWW